MHIFGSKADELTQYLQAGLFYATCKHLNLSNYYYEKSLLLSRYVHSNHPVTADILYRLGLQYHLLYILDNDNVSANNAQYYSKKSYKMYKSLKHHDPRTLYHAALQAGISLGKSHQRIPFMKEALYWQQLLPNENQCIMCSIRILYLLGDSYMPHDLTAIHENKMHNISYAIQYFNDSLHLIRTLGLLPIPKQPKLNISYDECNEFNPNNSSQVFEPKDYCLVGKMLFFLTTAHLYTGEYVESCIALGDLLELELHFKFTLISKAYFNYVLVIVSYKYFGNCCEALKYADITRKIADNMTIKERKYCDITPPLYQSISKCCETNEKLSNALNYLAHLGNHGITFWFIIMCLIVITTRVLYFIVQFCSSFCKSYVNISRQINNHCVNHP